MQLTESSAELALNPQTALLCLPGLWRSVRAKGQDGSYLDSSHHLHLNDQEETPMSAPRQTVKVLLISLLAQETSRFFQFLFLIFDF